MPGHETPNKIVRCKRLRTAGFLLALDLKQKSEQVTIISIKVIVSTERRGLNIMLHIHTP
jgi:hypothetical protein